MQELCRWNHFGLPGYISVLPMRNKHQLSQREQADATSCDQIQADHQKYYLYATFR